MIGASTTLPDIVQIRVRASCPTHSRTEILAGSHKVVVDEPAALGGTNLGPTPVQALLSSWLGCINVILSRIAQANGIPLHGLELECEAVLRTNGVRLEREVAAPLEKILLRLRTSNALSTVQKNALLDQLHQFCPLSTILRASGAQITEDWDDSASTVAPQ